MPKNLDPTGRKPPAQPLVKRLSPSGMPKARFKKLPSGGQDPRSKRR